MMDHGPPDPKRARLGSGSWPNGHSLPPRLPPLAPPQGSYPPGQPPQFARTISQPTIHQHEEHRRHEGDFQAPMQEPRPHTVANHSYPTYGPPRDAPVKRDPAEVSPHHQYPRHHSAGDVPTENTANNYQPDDGRRPSMSYEQQNGPPPVMNNPAFRPPPPPYGPAPPIYASNQQYEQRPPPPQQYEQAPQTPGALRDQIHLNIAYATSSGPNYNRRKAPRTSQACDACRAAKAKCDDPKPCTSCKEKDIECVWKTPEPKHGDRVQAEILDVLRNGFQRQEEGIQRQEEIDRGHRRRLAKLKRALIQIKPELEDDLKSDAEDVEHVKGEDAAFATTNGPTALSPVPMSAETPMETYTYPTHPYVTHEPDEVLASAEEPLEDVEIGRRILPGEPAIPQGHSTGAARLLLWPAVSKYLAEFFEKEKKPLEAFVEYPNILEERHGIRLYGRGPGSSRSHSSDGSPEDGSSEISSSPGPDLVYGQIGGFTPPPGYPSYSTITSSATSTRKAERRGGATEDGQLELDEETVNRLVDSYLTHIHIMHPILNPAILKQNTRKFLKSLPPNYTSRPTKSPAQPGVFESKFVGSAPGGMDTPGSKRKRSPMSSSEYPLDNTISPYPLKPGRPQRSIRNAVLLLVLALGKICEHKDKIPDLVPEHDPGTGDSPHARSGWGSPMITSPVTASSGLPSPRDPDARPLPPRRASTSVDSSSATANPAAGRAIPVYMRNLDVIPGLAYAAVATDILGNEMGDTSLEHVHAGILASLYFGQLARPVHAHQWVVYASGRLQMILRLKLERLKRYTSPGVGEIPKKDNPVVFAFWTCLQLESDIIAELDLPQSNITMHETNMPWPNFRAAHEEDKICTALQAESYGAQLFLRNHLNTIHSKVYGPNILTGRSLEEDYRLDRPVPRIVNDLIDQLPNIKSAMAPRMLWRDGDPPARDLLEARLRAKYAGMENITYRPFLKMVLNRPSRLDPEAPMEGPAEMGRLRREGGPAGAPAAAGEEVVSEEVLGYAKRCLDAMIASTRAFWGVARPGPSKSSAPLPRLIVTNVWGTAHAQWGNVLLLLVAYQDPLLRGMIEREVLRELVSRTRAFLAEVADARGGSALGMDLRVLEWAAWRGGFLEGAPAGGSTTTATTTTTTTTTTAGFKAPVVTASEGGPREEKLRREQDVVFVGAYQPNMLRGAHTGA